MERGSLLASRCPSNPEVLRMFANEAERRGVKTNLEPAGLREIADKIERLEALAQAVSEIGTSRSLWLASRLLPPGYAIWTYGQYGDDGLDEQIVAKGPLTEMPDGDIHDYSDHPEYPTKEGHMTDKEALDTLAKMFNEEPSDQELEAVGMGLAKVREIVRLTGREVAENRPEPIDPEPPSGY